MYAIAIDASLLLFYDELVYQEAAMLADPDASPWVGPISELVIEWDAVFARERQVRLVVMRSQAHLAVRDYALDASTRSLVPSLVADSGRDSKLFKHAFPEAPSKAIGWALRRQCEHTLRAIVPDLESLPVESRSRAFAAPLRTAAEQALAALDARNARKAEASLAGIEIDEWKEGVNRARFGVYANLIQVAASKGYGKDWAASFFRPKHRTVTHTDEEAEPSA